MRFRSWWSGWGGRRAAATPASLGSAEAVEPAGAVNGFDVLDKLAALPVSTWRYTWEPEHVRHLGPMAQDWKAAFALGDADTRIPLVDANGVALVSIQALYKLVTELRAEVDQLHAQLRAQSGDQISAQPRPASSESGHPGP